MFATSSIARHLQGSTEYRMFKIEGDLYLAAPGYRGLVSELRRLKVENGALAAAYQNALNRSATLQGRSERAMRTMAGAVEQRHRDDPGRGGTG